MNDSASGARYVRFGAFELDLRSNELRKGPTCLKVPDQSIEVLKALLEQPGELVTREALGERLWPANNYVDFEHGLNAAVRRLRNALGDSASNPKFIETLRRRGYRFIATIDGQARLASSNINQLCPTMATVQPTANNHPQFGSVSAPVAIGVASTAVALLTAVSFAWMSWSVSPPIPPAAFPTPIPKRFTFDSRLAAHSAFSPDGRSIVYVTTAVSSDGEIFRFERHDPGPEPATGVPSRR